MLHTLVSKCCTRVGRHIFSYSRYVTVKVSCIFSPCPLELTHFWNNLRKLIDGLRCIDNFTSRCLDAQHREFFHMLYAGTKQVIVDLCEDEDYQKGRYKSPLLRIPSD